MRVLFYIRQDSTGGGPSSVAYYLSRSLEKSANVTYYPRFASYLKRIYSTDSLGVFSGFFKREFDVVHFNLPPTLANGSAVLMHLAKRIGTATLMNVHGIVQLERIARASARLERMPQPHSWIRTYKGLSNSLISCRAVDAVVVNTEYMRGNVAVWYGIDTQKIVVIPNGVDIGRFSSSNHGSFLDGDPRILYVGALTWTKGIDVLFRAVARLKSELPSMRLHLVGTLVRIPREFRLLARKEGIDQIIVFHDWVPHSVLPRYYGSADVCVFPSRLESFGLVILEAMASRVPIVASDIPSFREILSNGKSGLLFECGNDKALSTAILKLVNDSVLGSRLSHIAFESVKTYSWENIAKKYLALYHRLCERYSDSN